MLHKNLFCGIITKEVITVQIDKNADYIIEKLNAAGYEAYAVGGCVRDMLLGREVSDYDITTNALPEETKQVFSSHAVIETGIKHGTVTVLLEHVPYEVTTYRVESCYTDSRHPDKVEFVRDINADLARRDFTMNAVAFSQRNGIVDPFGGIADINSGVIRAVGNPQKRFSEDALRILRALRFSSVLGFSLESGTSNAVFDLSRTLSKVSPERIYSELKKLICGKNAASVITEYNSVVSQIIPLNGDIASLSCLPNDFSMRITHLCGANVAEVLEKLRADNQTKQTCKLLASSVPIPDDRIELKQYISVLGRENALLVAAYRRALYGEDRGNLTEQIINSSDCLDLKDLAVNGSDLISIKIKGKAIGETLRSLLDLVLKEKIVNEKELLLAKAKELNNKRLL